MPAENPRRQQMCFSAKSGRLQFAVHTFAHDPPHVLAHQLQVAQQDSFPLTATFGVLGNLVDVSL
jgi:hypothetical protein